MFRNHTANGHWSLVRRISKFLVEMVCGKKHESASMPFFSGGHAAVRVLPPENASVIT